MPVCIAEPEISMMGCILFLEFTFFVLDAGPGDGFFKVWNGKEFLAWYLQIGVSGLPIEIGMVRVNSN